MQTRLVAAGVFVNLYLITSGPSAPGAWPSAPGARAVAPGPGVPAARAGPPGPRPRRAPGRPGGRSSAALAVSVVSPVP